MRDTLGQISPKRIVEKKIKKITFIFFFQFYAKRVKNPKICNYGILGVKNPKICNYGKDNWGP